ncbi:MAG: alpha-amylase family protein [Armatimonadota bacterium]
MISNLFAISSTIITAADPESPEPIIGWCCFYPGIDVGMEHVCESGSTGMSVCAAGIYTQKEEGVFDYSNLDKQIEFAEKNNQKLALISEVNPLFAPKWIREKMIASGQAIKGYGDSDDPRDGGMPSIQSPIFKEIQEDTIRRAIEHIKERDVNHVVTNYHPGAEWWFLPGYRYNPLDVADFRRWIQSRYTTIDVLNDRWQSSYKSFDEVPAPAIDFINKENTRLQEAVWVEDGGLDCMWCTELASDIESESREPSSPVVTVGKTYKFTAWVKCDDLSAPGASCAINWIDAQTGKPIYGGGAVGASVYGTSNWQQISMTATAPNSTGRVQLVLKTGGAGTVTFDNISFTEEGSGINLAPNPMLNDGDESPSGWLYKDSPSKRVITHSYLKTGGHDGGPCVTISSPRTVTGSRGFANEHAPVNDWANYWYEIGADYINYCSGLYKKYDPSRPVATYLTFAFAYPAEWDYTQWTAIAPDEVAMRGTNIDEIGLQTCAADKDPYRITACLDLIRKYNKPMWIVDLIDFTSGVNIGYEALDKITQASVQHGAKGLIYCSWHMPSVLDYSYYPLIPTENLNCMLSDAETAVKLVEGMSIKAKVAIIEPILPLSPADKEGIKNDFKSFMGWYKILENMHLTFDIVTLNEIEKGTDLSGYQWMLLPDCAYIQPAALSGLQQYIDKGGQILSSGRLAEFDEIGRPMSTSIDTVTIPDYGKAYAGHIIRDTHAGNTPPLFLWRDETPETLQELEAAKSKVGDFISVGGYGADVSISTDNPGIRSVVYEGDGSRAVYLVNLSDGNADDVSLRMKFDGQAKVEVYADVKASEFGADQSGGWVEINLPEFRSSCIVKLVKA